MMKKFYLILTCAALCACGGGNKQQATATYEKMEEETTISLPILDLEKKFPQKVITLQDIADVEYIVLETHDDGLVGSMNTTITDKFIITYTGMTDQVVFFHRDGRFSHSFYQKGPSGKEYNAISDLRVNPKLEEIYINDNLTGCIQVYTYQGEYKRTIKLRGNGYMMGAIFNCDDNSLLVEDWWNVDDEKKKKTNQHPYYKVSITDGTMEQLPLKIENRIRDAFKWQDGELYGSITTGQTPIAYINDKLIIADFALDTVYAYQNNQLIPIAVRQNQFKDNEIPLTTSLEVITDKYYLWHSVEKDFKKTVLPDKFLLQDRHTGKCIQIKLVDQNIIDKKFRFRREASANTHTVPKNHALQHYPAYVLIELLEEGKLQGELKEIASKLTEEDNPVIMLAKFK